MPRVCLSPLTGDRYNEAKTTVLFPWFYVVCASVDRAKGDGVGAFH
jgi:hypothetical protein